MIIPDSFFVIGNWKTNPASHPEALVLAKNTLGSPGKGVKVVVCPPSLFFGGVSGALPPTIARGVQNIITEPGTSSFTGGVSASQAVSAGARYVIVGHSSRRAAGETDHDVNLKIRACRENDIIPIVCVGEKARDEKGEYINELKIQIESSFAGFEKQDFEHIIIAYEPLWAIGAAAQREATPTEAQEIRILIEKTIDDMTGNIPLGRITTVYGGSVSTPDEVAAYAAIGMRGVLVGRISLDAKKFNALVVGANNL